PLGLQRFQELPARGASELILVVAKHVDVVGVAGATAVALGYRNAGNLLKLLREILGVLFAFSGLLFDARQLRQQQGCLKFRHAQIRATLGVGEAGGSFSSPAVIVKRIAFVHKLSVVGDDGAALAGIEVLARLETKAAARAKRSQLLAAPFAE